jgi:hypothetical protein
MYKLENVNPDWPNFKQHDFVCLQRYNVDKSECCYLIVLEEMVNAACLVSSLGVFCMVPKATVEPTNVI